MVQLRSRSAAPVRPPRNSLTARFSTGKLDTKRGTISAEDDEAKLAASIPSSETASETSKKRRDPRSANGVKSAATSTLGASASPSKRRKKEAVPESEPLPYLARDDIKQATTIHHPRLPFDLNEAVTHLKNVDPRFSELLDSVELKPYLELEEGTVRELDLFKTLTTSILGQQVSWLAARVIVYRFCRLFFPDQLPEKHNFDVTPRDTLPFPHPLEVCQADDAFLRSAGLSGAKVRYVKDVARRFSDGRLDVRRIVELEEEACIAELVKINGVGRWTAEMLLMFALRRGNILPVGDLGVQRGMLHFFLASDKRSFKIDEKKKKAVKQEADSLLEEQHLDGLHDASAPVQVMEEHFTESQREVERETKPLSGALKEHLTGPPAGKHVKETPLSSTTYPSLPEGITQALLQSRRSGKKAKNKHYLTPEEMDALTVPWQPYRSIGVYLMWALID